MSLNQAILPPNAETDDRYHVDLPDFFGPMDLLLTLIEQEELEITRISLAQVTDQYLEYINTLPQITPDSLTQFLVVAAKLILLKSQTLLPKPPPSIIIEEEEDAADDLIRQLKDYKRFKQLAKDLGDVQANGQRSFVRVAPLPKIEPKLKLGDLNIDDLLVAVRKALAVKPEPANVDTVVSREVITIGHQIRHIRHRLTQDKAIKFNELLTGARSRVEIIVTLLAVLELVKRRVLMLEQPENFGQITILKKEDTTLTEDDWAALSRMESVS